MIPTGLYNIFQRGRSTTNQFLLVKLPAFFFGSLGLRAEECDLKLDSPLGPAKHVKAREIRSFGGWFRCLHVNPLAAS